MAIKAAIFDLDNTLIDSEIFYVEVMQAVLATQGHALTKDDLIALCWGRSWQEIHQHLVLQKKTSFVDVKAMTDAVDTYIREADLKPMPIAGSIELVKRMHGQLPMCIASGSTRGQIELYIGSYGIAHCFSFIIGAEDYVHGKPSPEPYLKAAQTLGLKPEECLVFEDSEHGVAAAKKAGMHCVALSCHNYSDVSAADLILTDLATFQLGRFQDRILANSP